MMKKLEVSKMTVLSLFLIIIFFSVYLFNLNYFQIKQDVIVQNGKDKYIFYMNFESIKFNSSGKYPDESYKSPQFSISNWTPFNGKWYVIDNILFEDGSTPLAHIILNKSYSNFTFSANIYPISSYDVGIVYGWLDSGNWYYIDIYDGIRVFKRIDNIDTQITGITEKTPLRNWYTLKITAHDGHLKIYKNDILKIDMKEDFKAGKLGLKTYMSKAKFRNIYITKLSDNTINITLKYQIIQNNNRNISIIPFLVETSIDQLGSTSYYTIYTFPSVNYTTNTSTLNMNNSLLFSFASDIIRSPDIVYFPTDPYNRTFAIRFIAKGWDEEKHEWVFKEFMSPEFTWEDVVEGRTIAADGNRTT